MSWWTGLRDAFEATFIPFAESDSARKQTTGYTGLLNRGYSAAGGAVNKALGRESSADKRIEAQNASDQITAYKEQTRLAQEETDRLKNQEQVEKRRVNEKQIRLLRNQYRAGGTGMLGSSSASGSTLGSSGTSQPTKLGT
jgi:transcription initiation factor TFIID subunit TAF12